MFHTLDEFQKGKKENKDNKKTTDSYVGGKSSGIAVANPEDDDYIQNMKYQGGNKEHFEQQKNKVILKVYKNGFFVDDGPFRPIEVAENKKFMDEIEQGYIPQEFVDKGFQDCGIALEDHKKEDYEAPVPEKKFEAFLGSGVSLSKVSAVGTGEVDKDVVFNIDPNEPTTKINFRLYTGDVVNQEFNLTHTLADVFQYVMQVAPVNGTFQLIEGFPPKPVTQMNKTIAELKLGGSMLTQKLC